MGRSKTVVIENWGKPKLEGWMAPSLLVNGHEEPHLKQECKHWASEKFHMDVEITHVTILKKNELDDIQDIVPVHFEFIDEYGRSGDGVAFLEL